MISVDIRDLIVTEQIHLTLFFFCGHQDGDKTPLAAPPMPFWLTRYFDLVSDSMRFTLAIGLICNREAI